VTRAQAAIGTRVRALRAFSGVPAGTEGVVDEQYMGGAMVAWDLPEAPLPPGYREHDGVPAVRSRILRDGFGDDELDMLEVV
jgi:hypothetical protein